MQEIVITLIIAGTVIYLTHLYFTKTKQYNAEKEMLMKTLEQFRAELQEKYKAFDHNFAEINKKLSEHDSQLTKSNLGILSGLKHTKQA